MRICVVVIGLGCAVSLAACMGDDTAEPALTCDLANTGRALDGEWSLTGKGRREGCDDRRLEGDLTLENPSAFGVRSRPEATQGPATGPEVDFEADAFVVRIRRADYVLELEGGEDSALVLQGGAVGSCVSFSLSEELEGGDRLSYRFDGYITDSHTVSGDFWGDGPESCEVTGTFELEVR
jgi:hypothetical protein